MKILKKIIIISIVILAAEYTIKEYTVLENNLASSTVGKSNLGNLALSYNRWKADYENSQATLKGPAIGLTWNKGLSSEYSDATGIANINLETGFVSVNIEGNIDETLSDVWLVDNIDKEGSTVQPESSDRTIYLGSLKPNDKGATLNAQLDLKKLNGLEIDWIVIARKDSSLADGGVLYGSTSLFQKIYHYPQYSLNLESKAKPTLPSLISTTVANGVFPRWWFPEAKLVNDGRKIFFNTTFNGNGRTCGTCHPATNNYTLDPKFIATLPNSDPLFIAERRLPNPLANNFEDPQLMRKVGLIKENTNGFNDLERNYTMRAVSHVLGLNTSLAPPSMSANDGTVNSNGTPVERTGWSGDGSPSGTIQGLNLTGTLRDFTVGAIRQHFPKTLNRTPGTDFRLPTEYELDALEAFMLSLGRQEKFDDFNQISMNDERADKGRLNYMGKNIIGKVSCNSCHFNGGANTDPNFDFPAAMSPPAFEMTNRSFAPRVEELLDQHADLVNISGNPRDDGFGSGTNLFNVPTVIEAADTGPFFHKHQINTVEAMIAFYSSQRHLQDGTVLPAIVGLNGSQVANVGAFLRVLNADENARSAILLIDQANGLHRYFNRNDIKLNLKLARAEITDAIEVLEEGDLHFSDALPLLRKAHNYAQKQYSAHRAADKLQQVREIMINR